MATIADLIMLQKQVILEAQLALTKMAYPLNVVRMHEEAVSEVIRQHQAFAGLNRRIADRVALDLQAVGAANRVALEKLQLALSEFRVPTLSESVGDAARLASSAAQQTLASQQLVGLSDMRQTAIAIRDTVLALKLPDHVAELVRSFPGPPESVSAEGVDDWRAGVLRWAVNVLNALTNPEVDAGAIYTIVVALVTMVLSAIIGDYQSRPLLASVARLEKATAETNTELRALRQPPSPWIAITNRHVVAHTDPNSRSPQLQRLSSGRAVTVFRCEGQWCWCEYADRTGEFQQGWLYKPRLSFFQISK